MKVKDTLQVGLTSFHDLTTLLPLELWSQDFKDKEKKRKDYARLGLRGLREHNPF